MTQGHDFYEIDFLDVETNSSGDSIVMRIVQNGIATVSVVDGGYKDFGTKIIDHIKAYYDVVSSIKHVVLTHPDGDHASGLKSLLESFTVERLWMNRPWKYVDLLIQHYPTYNNRERLVSRLKGKYPHIRDLEEIAEERGVLIEDPLQGAKIGEFTVLSPSLTRFISLVLEDDDKAEEWAETASERLTRNWLIEVAKRMISFVSSLWGEENLPDRPTSPRNEMSVVQYGNICGHKIMLTGDAGRSALREAIDYAPYAGLVLPGIDKFQVPHHGSRRNVSTEILDELLGARHHFQPGNHSFTAIISSAKKDPHHPKKAVVRAMIHRGGKVITTEGSNVRISVNAPPRDGWSAAEPAPYPSEQEE